MPNAIPEGGGSNPPASLLRRLAALIYDALLLLAVWFAATFLALLFRNGQAFSPHDPWFSAYLALISFVFFGWFWTHGGQTLGMRTWKIRLVALDSDARISWRCAWLRFMVAWASVGLLGLGYVWGFLDPLKRSWHDLASGTRVVMSPRQRDKD